MADNYVHFVTVHHYSWLSPKNADFTGIIQHHSLLYCLSAFVFIHMHPAFIWGGNWGKSGVAKRAVTMPPLML